MPIYNKEQASEYDRIVDQPVYKFYVNKKLLLIEKWINKESFVLDVGCGTGVYTTLLSKKCRTIVGLDVSSKMVERGATKARNLGLDNVHFVVADVEYFPFQDKVFDLVFSVNLFHHVIDKKIITMGFLEQVRSCRHKKHILVFELNPNSLGWSDDFIPRIIRGFVYIVLFPFRQKVTDNVEEGTRMIVISELLGGIKETQVVLRKVGGFIPTYCPEFLFKSFVLLEKIMEATPLLRRYGAHVLLVGEVH